MRIKILLIMLLGLVFSMSAHILEEGFENSYVDSLTGETIIPGGWQIIDNDGDSYNWYSYSIANTAHSGAKSLTSESWKAGIGALTPDNWLISPAITLEDTTYLYWWIATQDDEFPNENYGVYLSTTGDTISDFTILLFSEVLEADNEFWQHRSLDLMEWAGETVYLAWRHHNCTDNYKVKIDDILVTTEFVDNDHNDLVVSASSIDQVYPNPFNPETNISYIVNEPGMVNLAVYNIRGQKVETLVSGSMYRGQYSVVWQANDQPSGMYLFRLISQDGVSSSKGMLLK
jgi:Cleaved Adhesin Domain/Secretion system C-terminal sorting domain